MALTRLKNIITSRTGRIIYVNPDDFDASDSIDNRGNSSLRPFKSLQRAFLEVARFSYRVGLSNDEFDAFSILLYPSEYIVDNRPGEVLYTNIPPLDANSNMDVTSPNNVLYKFNSVEGGMIVPRGCSLVGMDLRRTKIIPKYVPYPTTFPAKGINTEEQVPSKTAIFRVTGGCYFWQFSLFDGDSTGVYYKPDDSETIPPSYSHHKLTGFEFADGNNTLSQLINDLGTVENSAEITGSSIPNLLERTDLDIYYQKVSRGFATIPDTSGDPATDQIQARVEENRIVGPISDEFRVLQITRNGNTATAITVDEQNNPKNHGFSVGVNVNISGVTGSTGPQTDLDAQLYNGSFAVTSASGNVFTYQLAEEPSGNAVGSNVVVKVEIDTVDSASPYMFNLSLRSVWGMNGMHADGAKATGFKSMVVAQYTGLSLQKDDRAFVKYNATTGNYDEGGPGAHLDGFAEYKKGWRHTHVMCSNDSFIQVVSVFAVGYADHFAGFQGADMSITNSNSNFGNTALRSKGFKRAAFTKDKAGTITHIIPPKSLADVDEISVNWTNIDIKRTLTINPALAGQGGVLGSRLYLYGYTNETAPPPNKVQGYVIGARQDGLGASAVPDKINCLLIPSPGSAPEIKTAEINPFGPNVSGTSAGGDGSPIQFDSSTYTIGGVANTVGGWYISVNATDNQIYQTLVNNSSSGNPPGTYANLNFTPTTFIKRVPDARNLTDRTYRVRYVIPKDQNPPLPRSPIAGFVLQPNNTDNTDYKLSKCYYIYDIQEVQKFERGISDGIFYLTLLCGSIAPTTSNFDDMAFSQNVNEVYPAFDRDNPNADPEASVSVADNETIGLVYGTDGASPVPARDDQRSITKEATLFLLNDTGWVAGSSPGWNSINNTLSGIELTARLGDEETRKIPILQDSANNDALVPINVELRRHSILRSGNHTFEYTGFGPGNYSTAFPQTQVETLSDEQIRLSQSLKEEAGVAFYSGLNSNGDLFIGNQVINPVTGQITSEDIAQLNVLGEENTTIETFSEVVITDKLTVIGGASNNLESIFSGPATFQGTITSQKDILAKKLTYNNQDGTVLKSTLLAPELKTGTPPVGQGTPDLSAVLNYNAPSDGDIVYNIDWEPGKNLGWMYYESVWYKFGLTNTDVFQFGEYDGSYPQHIGLGRAPSSTYRLEVEGSQRITGDLRVDGRGGVAPDKYITRRTQGDGSTLNYQITSYAGVVHTSKSVIVTINGVLQHPDVNYTVDTNGTNVVFASGDAPTSNDFVEIRELPI